MATQHESVPPTDEDIKQRINQQIQLTQSLFKETEKTTFPQSLKVSVKLQDEYGDVLHLAQNASEVDVTDMISPLIQQSVEKKKTNKTLPQKRLSSAIVLADIASDKSSKEEGQSGNILSSSELVQFNDTKSLALREKRQKREWNNKPTWHAPWKLMRVISGHNGWVRSIAVDCSNEWFAAGGTDRTIKVHDLASGQLKLTLTGHISAIRGLAVSARHPYLFSVGEDKTVKCWDLEKNKCVRQYHGHLSAVYCCALHPTLDVLVTGGRDSSARVWDLRTKEQIFLLSGHGDTVGSVIAQSCDPQIVTGSQDSTVRLWDLRTGKTRATLTNHKKSVRALAVHPNEYTFASASSDHLKKWQCPDGVFLQNFTGHEKIINTISVNADNVLVSGSDDGGLYFWDWNSGYNFHKTQTIPQPGSLDSEAGIFCSTFDQSGSRLLTGEADKTIKVWKEDETATPETHPIDWKPQRNLKRY
ncbi:pre-mRNA splicing factor prp46 [Acrasis kona]|uniref:Pre-mRNA splicing factor prp46 n=1 Tax=Acrasis kona TaxID=1008807 RepID=A0AAW2ZBF3_9EUKA